MVLLTVTWLWLTCTFVTNAMLLTLLFSDVTVNVISSDGHQLLPAFCDEADVILYTWQSWRECNRCVDPAAASISISRRAIVCLLFWFTSSAIFRITAFSYIRSSKLQRLKLICFNINSRFHPGLRSRIGLSSNFLDLSGLIFSWALKDDVKYTLVDAYEYQQRWQATWTTCRRQWTVAAAGTTTTHLVMCQNRTTPVSLSLVHTSTKLNKKAVLPQGNRAIPQVFFSVEVRQQHSLQV